MSTSLSTSDNIVPEDINTEIIQRINTVEESMPLTLQKEFITQNNIKDVFINMINGYSYEHILSNNNDPTLTSSKKGFIYEAIANMCIITKQSPIQFKKFTLDNFNNLPSLSPCENFKVFLENSIHNSGGSSDLTLIDNNEKFIPSSTKYRDNITPQDLQLNQIVTKIKEIKGMGYNDYQLFAVVKDKQPLLNHRHMCSGNVHKCAFDKVVNDKLLFDQKDVKVWFQSLQRIFSGMEYEDAIEKCNKEYLNTERQSLKLRLHQKLFELKFLRNYNADKRTHLLNHKMRSGKSIALLNICSILLSKYSMKKILIMTSVPDTIDSFINALECFIPFKNINYDTQKNFLSIDQSFEGIVFCSVQYLKHDKNSKKQKQQKLVELDFDCMIFDESHHGSSNSNTRNKIIEQEELEIDELNKLTKDKLVIFSSGTGDKTKLYYDIPQSCVYYWNITDESHMKNINIAESVQHMTKKHGACFNELLEDDTLDKDYSKYPAQVLIKSNYSERMVELIRIYNSKHPDNESGIDWSSVFALKTDSNTDYVEEFEICQTDYGKEMLVTLLELMISSDRNNKDTMMQKIYRTQKHYGSITTSKKNPGMFIVYLPTRNRTGSINLLQKTLYRFLEKNNLWQEYNIEYTNSTSSSLEYTGSIKNFITKCMINTKTKGKKGCILLLGDKGTLGIDYPDCLATISIDNGKDLNYEKQKRARAYMPAVGKTIAINVDMNSQRVFTTLQDMMYNYKKYNPQSTKTYAEIIKHYFEHNIFIFDPDDIDFGRNVTHLTNHYIQIAKSMSDNIDVEHLLNDLKCDDELQQYIKDIKNSSIQSSNTGDSILNGDQPDCPQATKKKKTGKTTENVNVDNVKKPDNVDNTLELEEIKDVFKINKTKKIAKLIPPIIALAYRGNNSLQTLEDCWNDPTYKEIIKNKIFNKFDIKKYKIMTEEKIISIYINIMNKEYNNEMVEQVKEVFLHASPKEYRKLIDKHFIPSREEKYENAEIATKPELVDEMLTCLPDSFYSKLVTILEPCCGKGNFVLGIFDKLFNNLTGITDIKERCKTIIEKCIYFTDLEFMNVHITKIVLQCYADEKTNSKEVYNFNSYVCDTLGPKFLQKLNEWNITIFDAVIGNPPYQTDPSSHSSTTLYHKFINLLIDKGDKLVFVVPSRWFLGGKGLDTFRKNMLKRRDIKLIKHVESTKDWFDNVSIAGGVNYFLKDSSYNGDCNFNGNMYNLSKYTALIKPKYHESIDTILTIINNQGSLTKIYKGRYFKVETNDARLLKKNENGTCITCYVSKKKSTIRINYLKEYDFGKDNIHKFWKVVSTEANGNSESFNVDRIAILGPNTVHSGSYVSFKVNNENEAKSLASYMKTDFVRTLIIIKKTSQHFNSKVCEWVPLVPFDRIWDNEAVYTYFNIDKKLFSFN